LRRTWKESKSRGGGRSVSQKTVCNHWSARCCWSSVVSIQAACPSPQVWKGSSNGVSNNVAWNAAESQQGQYATKEVAVVSPPQQEACRAPSLAQQQPVPGVVSESQLQTLWRTSCDKKEYSDFVFEVEVKMPEGKCNSGFMFRAHKDKNKMFGYQAEVDPSSRNWSGGLFDEGRRRWFISPKERDKESVKQFRERAGDCFKRNDWNKYRISCKGDHIRIFVNDVLTTDCHDDVDAKGYIALQHHGEKGQTYRFRNIRIKELKQ